MDGWVGGGGELVTDVLDLRIGTGMRLSAAIMPFLYVGGATNGRKDSNTTFSRVLVRLTQQVGSPSSRCAPHQTAVLLQLLDIAWKKL